MNSIYYNYNVISFQKDKIYVSYNNLVSYIYGCHMQYLLSENSMTTRYKPPRETHENEIWDFFVCWQSELVSTFVIAVLCAMSFYTGFW